jgi:hypothetical protein
MISDEQAKAVKETAKAPRNWLRRREMRAAFSATSLMSLPQARGILADRLAFVRRERAIRFRDQVNVLLETRALRGELRQIPFKVGIPLSRQSRSKKTISFKICGFSFI